MGSNFVSSSFQEGREVSRIGRGILIQDQNSQQNNSPKICNPLEDGGDYILFYFGIIFAIKLL